MGLRTLSGANSEKFIKTVEFLFEHAERGVHEVCGLWHAMEGYVEE